MLFSDADPDMTPDFSWAGTWTGLLNTEYVPALSIAIAPLFHAQRPMRDLVAAMLALDGFALALTVKGRVAPEGAAIRLMLNAQTAWFRRYHDGRRTKDVDRLLRFTAIKDQDTCLPAYALHGQVFNCGDAPTTPLAICDAYHCRCSLTLARAPRRRS